MGRHTSENRIEDICVDLLRRLPPDLNLPLDGPPTRDQRDHIAGAIVEALWGKSAWRDRDRRFEIEDRACQAADALVMARQRDIARGRYSTVHRRKWMDRWVLILTEDGLTGSRAGQEALRGRLLTRQRDQERRSALKDADGKTMRLVLSEELDVKLRALKAPLGAESKQAVIERLIELAHAQHVGSAALTVQASPAAPAALAPLSSRKL